MVWAIFHLSAPKTMLIFLRSPTLGFPVSFMCPQSHCSWKLPSAFVFLPLPSLTYMAVIWGPMPLTLPFYILPLVWFLCPTTSTPNVDPILLMPRLEQRLFDSSPLLPPVTSLVSFPVWLICTLRMGLYHRALVSPEETSSERSIQIWFFRDQKVISDICHMSLVRNLKLNIVQTSGSNVIQICLFSVIISWLGGFLRFLSTCKFLRSKFPW